MMEKKNTLWIVIAVIIGIFLLSKYQTQTDMIGIQIHYLKDGQEISTNKLFSLITPPSPALEADQVYFTINGKNIGGTDLTNIIVASASPVEFKNSIPSTIQTLSAGETKPLWITNPINLQALESYSQPITFFLNISAYDNYYKKTAYVTTSANFQVIQSLPSLIILSGTTSLGGDLKYSSVYVAPGATLAVNSVGYLNITATQNITILGTIDGDSKGNNGGSSIIGYEYCNGNAGSGTGAGSGGGYDSSSPYGGGGGGGGGFGGTGGNGGSGNSAGGGNGGSIHDLKVRYPVIGSGGGSGGGVSSQTSYQECSYAGSKSGAGIKLNAPYIIIKGLITSRGQNLNPVAYGGGWAHQIGGGGGGSGGSIILDGNIVDISSSTLDVSGGTGGGGSCELTDGLSRPGASGGGGGGGGGIINIFYSDVTYSDSVTQIVSGGSGGSAYILSSGSSANNGGAGGNGEVYILKV